MRVLAIHLRKVPDEAQEQGNRGRRRWDISATLWIAALITIFLAGCSGVVGQTSNGSEPPGPSGDTGGLLGGGGGSTPPSSFHPAPATLRRLTVAQYQNSVRDLLGGAITTPTDLEPDSSISGFALIAAARVALSAHATEQFETAALALAHQALADAATRSTLVKCAPSGPTDAACASQFVTSLGRRAWRRPLTTDEVTRYAAIATTAGGVLKDFYTGLEYAIAGILQSPHFLYREELGAPRCRRSLTASLSELRARHAPLVLPVEHHPRRCAARRRGGGQARHRRRAARGSRTSARVAAGARCDVELLRRAASSRGSRRSAPASLGLSSDERHARRVDAERDARAFSTT